MLSMIVTVDRNWAISKDHKALIVIPDDQRFVRDITYGNVIITGRHTFENAFGGKVLPNRTMVIVSKDMDYQVPGADVSHSAREALEKAREYKKDIFVLGGSRMYNDLLPDCDVVYVTAVDYVYNADSFFPNLDKKPEWVMMDISEEQTHFDVVYYFKRYMKRKDYNNG